jgi:predicted ABC-type ATPase
MSRPICTVMVGLPGLGKSTLVNSEISVYDRIEMPVFVYSTDHYIENIAKMRGLTYDDVFAETIKEATQMCNDGLDSAIADEIDIVWDQTNLGAGKRRKIINRMKQAGYQVRCECIVPPEAGWIDDQKVWAQRLANRQGKTIPQNILTNMIESFTMPTIEEGFDMITFYNMHGALLGIDYGDE